MANRKNLYKVDFTVNNLSMKEQDHIFKVLLSHLTIEQRQNFHILVTDILGGQHYVWDGYGIDPDGIKCKKCLFIDCETCAIFKRRRGVDNGKNSNDIRTDREDK